jgi:hypothetical protein
MPIKFQTLQPWLDEILNAIKKDIRTDYLPGDATFYKARFGSRPLNRLNSEEINQAFSDELVKGNEGMGEWVVNRWVFKHGEVYTHFAQRLSKINEDFNAIQTLTSKQSEEILAGAVEAFGAKPVYFFSVLNGVVFPKETLEKLRKRAEEANKKEVSEASEAAQQLDLAKTIERHEREMSRMTEKYEQKLAGVLKKYTIETEALKKQVRALQLKLNAQGK